MKSVEKLSHFQCDVCKKWWTIGDAPADRTMWYCPWCGINQPEDGFPPAAEAFSEMREKFGHIFDGVDPEEFVKKIRGNDMSLDEYQEQSRNTAQYPSIGLPLVYPAIGLSDEAGEVLGKVKKLFRDYDGIVTEEFLAAMKKECGDVLWYLTQLCTELGLKMDDVAMENLTKLQSRAERGVIQGDGDER